MKPSLGFLPSPGMGHIMPLFQLARRISLHHRLPITFFIITTPTTDDVQTNFFSHQAALLPDNFHLLTIPPVDVSAQISDDMPTLTQLCIIVRESLKQLKPILVDIIPNALIIDIFTSQAIDVCNDLKIKVYSFFTASTALLTFSLYLPTLDEEVAGEYVDLPGPVKVPGCRSIRTQDLLDQVKNRKIDEYKWYLFHARRLPFVAGIFSNTWQALDFPYLNAMAEHEFYRKLSIPPIFPVGPLIKDEEFLTGQDRKILTWLGNQPPESVLFVSFGSGGALSVEEMTELAIGLEMSRQRFIFVVRKPRGSNETTSAAFFNPAGGENPAGFLPEGFVERTKGTGLVVENWAPQVAVLRSRSTGGFLTHCGWNSTLESLTYGVPIIAWPLYAEQRMNAAMLVEEIGVAVRPEGETVVGREEVERIVRALMEGEEGKAVRKRVKELEETARKALDRGGTSFDAISLAVNSMCTLSAWASYV